jgi:uncharacterized protein YciI
MAADTINHPESPRQRYVIDLNYVRPLSEVDVHVDEHRELLARQAEQGTVLASGPKSPRTGGVIVTAEVTRDEVEALIAADPFHRHGLADYSVTAVRSPLNAGR